MMLSIILVIRWAGPKPPFNKQAAAHVTSCPQEIFFFHNRHRKKLWIPPVAYITCVCVCMRRGNLRTVTCTYLLGKQSPTTIYIFFACTIEQWFKLLG